MTRKQNLIELIKRTPITSTAEITLDNLDTAELVEGEDGVCVENEHGTQFSLDELSEGELEFFCSELNLPERFDYLIMSDTNEWLSTGKFSTQTELDNDIAIITNENPDLTLVVFKANEFNTYSV